MKRSLLLIAFVLFSSQAAFATITAGDFTHDFFNSGAIPAVSSTAANHAAGNAIFVYCSTGKVGVAETVTGVTNTAGDTFVSTANAKRTGAVATRSEWWYVLSSLGNASDVVTCTWSGNVSFPIIVTAEFAHTGTLTLDTAAHSTAEVAATSYPVGSFSTAGAGLIVYGAQTQNGNTFTAPPTPAFTGTGNTAYGTAYRITSGVESSITPAGTSTGTDDWSAAALAVTEGGGGVTATSGLLLMGVGQ